MSITFGLTVLAWIFFRAENMSHAFSYLSEIFSKTFFTFPQIKLGWFYTMQIIVMILFFIIIEWFGRENEFALSRLGFNLKRVFRLSFYFFIILLIFLFMGKEQQFIYFQF